MNIPMIALRLSLIVSICIITSFKAVAGNSRCFLHGVLVKAIESADKSSISDLIRLNFEADSREKCERMMASYCTYNVRQKGYSPQKLVGYFKPDFERIEKTEYNFSADCQLSN